MFFCMGERMERVPVEEIREWEGIWAIVTRKELAGLMIPEPLRLRAMQEVQYMRYCQAQAEEDRMEGMVGRPVGCQGHPGGFAFVAWNRNLLVVEDSGFVAEETEKFLEKTGQGPATGGEALIRLLSLALQEDMKYMEELGNYAEDLEEAVLEGTLKEFDQNMMRFRKKISLLSRYYAQLEDLAAVLLENTGDFFQQKELRQLRSLGQKANRLWQETLNLREYSMQIREVYQAQIELRQNQIMKMLTIVTTIFLPLSLLAGWYGMNFKYMPELEWRYGYPALVLAGGMIVAFCLWIFKKKKFW